MLQGTGTITTFTVPFTTEVREGTRGVACVSGLQCVPDEVEGDPVTVMIEDSGDAHGVSNAQGEGKDGHQGTASVLKALSLLDVFRAGDASMGVSDIARRTGVPVSTAHRLLAYLVEGGFVAKDGTQYRPGGKLFELGNRVAHCRPQGLREQVAPYLGELYSDTGMTARLGVLGESEVVIVDKVVGLRTAPAPTAIGGRVPATCTALGKALLAFQPIEALHAVLQGPLLRQTQHSLVTPHLLHRQFVETRTTYLAYDRQESVLGQVCVATPLFRNGEAVAAISLSASAVRINLPQTGVALRNAARQIEARIEGGPRG